jgi:hypothetical protein
VNEKARQGEHGHHDDEEKNRGSEFAQNVGSPFVTP